MTHPRAEYLREYHLKNKEKRNARSKEHYYNNVEEIREQKKRYYQKHREEYSKIMDLMDTRYQLLDSLLLWAKESWMIKDMPFLIL